MIYARAFGPTDSFATRTQFLVSPGESVSEVAQSLKDKGYVRSTIAFQIALIGKVSERGIRPGGYQISQSMDAWTVAKTLGQPPYLTFITLPQGARKEQIADILADALFWSAEQKQEWITAAPADGVYYPDTYLVPSDQPPAQVAARLRGRFTDLYAQYIREAEDKGLDWNKVLTLASIVERESSKIDRPLVAGILWNRLEDGMKLQADATLQYVKGSTGNWWPIPRSEDKYVDSPFNTYKYAGLPPHPIATPSLESVAAVLHPDTTNCIYYLHDTNHKIHCSVTYKGQQHNVAKYLK